MVLRFPLRRFTLILVALVVFFALSHVLVLVLHNTHDNKVTELLVEKFSLDLERNFPTYFSALLLFTSSLLFYLIWWIKKQSPETRDSRYWLGLGIIFLFLSIDESAHIHEHFDTKLIWGAYKTTGLLAWPWVIVYGSLVTLFVLGYFKFWLRLPKAFKISYLLAGSVYVSSALGFEMLEALEYSTHQGVTTFKYIVLSSFEESLEMSAITFLIYTNMRYLAYVCPPHQFSFSITERDTV